MLQWLTNKLPAMQIASAQLGYLLEVAEMADPEDLPGDLVEAE